MRRKANGDLQFSFPSPIEYHANKRIDRAIETKGLSFSFIVSRSVQTHDRENVDAARRLESPALSVDLCTHV